MTDGSGDSTIRDSLNRLSADLRNMLIGTQGIGHNLTKGEVREEEIRSAFRPFIPQRFELSTGEVVNSDGQRSQQQDLIISDAYASAPFLASGRFGIHPIETVVACLQIKSHIDVGSLEGAIENVASVKRLLPSQPRGYALLRGGKMTLGKTTLKPFGGILALSKSGDAEGLARSFILRNQTFAPDERADCLVVVEDFLAHWVDPRTEARIQAPGQPPMTLQPAEPSATNKLAFLKTGSDSLLFFYSLLNTWFAQYPVPELDVASYVNAAGIRVEGVVLAWNPE